MSCYDIALKMTKIVINCSRYLLGEFEGMLIRGKMLVNGAI